MAEIQRTRRSRRAEAVVAAIVFVISCVVVLWFRVLGQLGHAENVWSVVLFFGLLVGSYIGLSVADARDWLRSVLAGPVRRLVIGPALLLGTVLLYAQATGLPVWPRAVGLAAYLCGPVALLILQQWTGKGASVFMFGAALALWLPIEFNLLPSLPLPPPDGYDVSQVVGIVAAFYLFLVARPLTGVGYTFALGRRDLRLAVSALAFVAVAALPFGFLTGFLTWQPRITLAGLIVTPVVIYLTTALPEEFLFRGVIQNLISQRWGSRVGLGTAAVIFGVAHLPDLRYVVLATLAGLAYGWVYARSGKITASALTHAGVDWIWVLLLSYP